MNFRYDALQLGTFDIAPLQAAVRTLTEDDWAANSRRQESFKAHSYTQTVWLIFNADYRHTGPTTHPAFERFQPVLAPVMDHVEAHYSRRLRQRRTAERHGPGYFIRGLLTRLAPGGVITPHCDGGYSLMRCHRIHLPIISPPECLFRVGDLNFHMPEGELWEINNRRMHGVENRADTARVHLILDYVQPGEVVHDVVEPIVA